MVLPSYAVHLLCPCVLFHFFMFHIHFSHCIAHQSTQALFQDISEQEEEVANASKFEKLEFVRFCF